jgi:hypothetical protein
MLAQESSPRGDGVERTLDFRGDTFPGPLPKRRSLLNFYTPTEPKRDLLPFTAVDRRCWCPEMASRR